MAQSVETELPMPRHVFQESSGWRNCATEAPQSVRTGARLMMIASSAMFGGSVLVLFDDFPGAVLGGAVALRLFDGLGSDGLADFVVDAAS